MERQNENGKVTFSKYVSGCLLGFGLIFVTCKGPAILVKQNEELAVTEVISNTLFQSKQIITHIRVPASGSGFRMTFAEAGKELIKTSDLAAEHHAVAAINGGFFNVKEGGSVTYFEVNDTVISYTKTPPKDRLKESYFLNGSLVINRDNRVSIESFRSDEFYRESTDELAVLSTGPLLLRSGAKLKLKDIPFVTKRHPRSCLCTNETDYFLIAIDGRSDDAAGMNLLETQDYLLSLGCKDAINLDGGGSTTLWTKEKGVVNNPSDKNGERKVSNALIVVREELRNKFR